MPLYFMNIHENGEVIRDLEGHAYPDRGAALSEAERAAREMLAEKIRNGEEVDGQKIEILDEAGRLVGFVPFRGQIRLRDEAPD